MAQREPADECPQQCDDCASGREGSATFPCGPAPDGECRSGASSDVGQGDERAPGGAGRRRLAGLDGGGPDQSEPIVVTGATAASSTRRPSRMWRT